MEEIIGEKMLIDFLFLADKLTDKKNEFLEYVKYIQTFPGLRLDSFHIGYFNENIKIAEMIPKDKVVIDVGCGFGFQHILFKDHKGWIGIQEFLPFNAPQEPELKVFTDNSVIINARFYNMSKLLELIMGEDKDKYFGMANHSLWHDQLRNKEDIEIFKKLFPINYYATDEGNMVIKYDA